MWGDLRGCGGIIGRIMPDLAAPFKQGSIRPWSLRMLADTRTHLVPAATLLGGILLTLAVRLFLLGRGEFDGLYGQDAYAYYNYAVGPLRSSVLALSGPPPFSWPPGYPYLVALITFVTGLTPLAGQAISLVLSLFTPVFAALLAWEVWGRERADSWAPALAGLLVAFAGQFWQSSIVVMTDITGLTMATLGTWALARYGREGAEGQPAGSVVWLLLASLSLALAILTRWAYALAAIPATGYALLLIWRRRAWLHGLLAAAAALTGLAPLLSSFLSNLLAPGEAGLAFVIDLQVVRWNPLNALRRSFETSDGFQQYRLPNGLYYLAAPAHRFFFTPLLALFLLPGLWVTWKQRTGALTWLVWGWAGIMFLFHAGIAWQSFRFTLAYLPPLAILAAIGMVGVLQVAGRWRPLVVAYIAFGFALMAWGGWTLSNSFIERKNEDLARLRWVESQAGDGAGLLTFNDTLTFQQYSDLDTYELYYQTPADMEALLAAGQPFYLLIDVNNVETQWLGRSPSDNYHWLQEVPGLTELGSRDNFTFFRVNKDEQDTE